MAETRFHCRAEGDHRTERFSGTRVGCRWPWCAWGPLARYLRYLCWRDLCRSWLDDSRGRRLVISPFVDVQGELREVTERLEERPGRNYSTLHFLHFFHHAGTSPSLRSGSHVCTHALPRGVAVVALFHAVQGLLKDRAESTSVQLDWMGVFISGSITTCGVWWDFERSRCRGVHYCVLWDHMAVELRPRSHSPCSTRGLITCPWFIHVQNPLPPSRMDRSPSLAWEQAPNVRHSSSTWREVQYSWPKENGTGTTAASGHLSFEKGWPESFSSARGERAVTILWGYIKLHSGSHLPYPQHSELLSQNCHAIVRKKLLLHQQDDGHCLGPSR